VSADLKLSRNAYAGIFLGTITKLERSKDPRGPIRV